MNAIPNSNPLKAIIKPRGINPIKKKIRPEVIILYVNPAKIFNSMCPLIKLAAKRNPKLIFLAKYEINSIKTNKGNKPKGQPAGTNKEKNFNPCLLNPNIVAPNTTVKLIENVNIKWLVEAKLYGIIPIKLFTNININNVYIKGKYICPSLPFI